jgi:uncharacterized protein (DUF983 family)
MNSGSPARRASAPARGLYLRCPECGEGEEVGLASTTAPFRCRECGQTSKIADCIIPKDTSMDDNVPDEYP